RHALRLPDAARSSAVAISECDPDTAYLRRGPYAAVPGAHRRSVRAECGAVFKRQTVAESRDRRGMAGSIADHSDLCPRAAMDCIAPASFTHTRTPYPYPSTR